MHTDTAPPPTHAPAQGRARHPVAQAVADVAGPHHTKLDHVAARGRLREVLTAHVRSLRAEGATASDVMAATNSIARRALAGVAPAQVSADIREAIRRWSLAAFERVD